MRTKFPVGNIVPAISSDCLSIWMLAMCSEQICKKPVGARDLYARLSMYMTVLISGGAVILSRTLTAADVFQDGLFFFLRRAARLTDKWLEGMAQCFGVSCCASSSCNEIACLFS